MEYPAESTTAWLERAYRRSRVKARQWSEAAVEDLVWTQPDLAGIYKVQFEPPRSVQAVLDGGVGSIFRDHSLWNIEHWDGSFAVWR